MNITFEKILNTLFILGLFFFSFNQIEVMPFMGEYVKESGAIFFFIGFFLTLTEVLLKGKISLPFNNKLFQFLILFYIITFLCTLINIPSVTENYFKKTSGISRFIRQYISLSIPIIVFITFFWRILKNWNAKEMFLNIRKIFLYTLLFASFYGFFEIGYSYFGFYPAKYVLEFIGLIFPFVDPHYHGEGRISVFAYEPPFFAIFLITISGWMFSYILTEKNFIYKVTPTLLIIILTFFSGSRTGLLVVFFILGLFILYLYLKNHYRSIIHNSLVIITSLILIVLTFNADKLIYSVNEKIDSLNFIDNLKTSISNKSRFGMQVASIEVFKENPIFGVGFGQQAYHSRHHYPFWATVNNWEFDLLYKNKNETSFPPGFNLYTRILAETGIVGLLSWLTLLGYSLYILIKIYNNNDDFYTKLLCVSLLITLIGLYINWLQTDTFRIYGVWLNFVIIMRLIYLNQSQKNESKSINHTSL